MFLAHRCARCGHVDYWSKQARQPGSTVEGHGPWRRDCAYPGCECLTQGCEWGPPMLVSRYQRDGQPCDTWAPPGTETTGVEMAWPRVYACACDDCLAFYRSQVDADYELPEPEGDDDEPGVTPQPTSP